MTQTTQLINQIKTATKRLRQNHNKAVRTVSSLKKKINDLELKISQENSPLTDADVKKLNSAMERLDALVDSIILKSANAPKEYEKLKRQCAEQTLEPAELKDLLTQCQKNEQLAKDLLCYSLAHLKRDQPTRQRNEEKTTSR